jgi:hypothetical protein
VTGNIYDAVQVNEPYLFTRNTGDGPLYSLLGDLLKMLCYPLSLHTTESDSGRLPYPTIAESCVDGDINFTHQIASPDTALSERYECGDDHGA